MEASTILECHRLVDDIVKQTNHNPMAIYIYNADDNLVPRFAQMFNTALDTGYEGYMQASIYNGDFKGFINFLERSVEELKSKIESINLLKSKQDLLNICESLHSRLIGFGVNPRNFIYWKGDEKEQENPVQLEIIQCFHLEWDTKESAEVWITKLHRLLQDVSYIDKCEYAIFRNMFSILKDDSCESSPVNWRDKVISFAFFIQELARNRFIGQTDHYVKASSCFTIKGKHKKSGHIKGAAQRAKIDVIEKVKNVFEGIKRQPN